MQTIFAGWMASLSKKENEERSVRQATRVNVVEVEVIRAVSVADVNKIVSFLLALTSPTKKIWMSLFLYGNVEMAYHASLPFIFQTTISSPG